jgi:hypothetical protein
MVRIRGGNKLVGLGYEWATLSLFKTSQTCWIKGYKQEGGYAS